MNEAQATLLRALGDKEQIVNLWKIKYEKF